MPGDAQQPGQSRQEKQQPQNQQPQKQQREKPIIEFADAAAFRSWLHENHLVHPGIRLKIAKKASSTSTVSYQEALDIALAYGWIDDRRNAFDADYFLQGFGPRRARSVWSKRNVDAVSAMIESGTIQPAGLARVDAAKADGRWERAYSGSPQASQSPEFLAALEANPAAKEFYATLNAVNRYAIYFRIHNAKREETKTRRIALFVDMLARGETLH